MIFHTIIIIFLLSYVTLVDSNQFHCGTSRHSKGLIVRGSTVSKGEFPFLCVLYNIESDQIFCGGSLVTSRHVLSAAHCIKTKDEDAPVEPSNLLVFLGRHNLKRRFELNSTHAAVSEIILHPEWKVTTTRFDADLAVIVLKNEIQFTMSIAPICLPNELDRSFDTDGTKGVVAGWGYTENSLVIQGLPRKVNLSSVTNEKCFLDQPDMLHIASLRTFCAIGENNGPCEGDSGGGFFEQVNGYWVLRGIVSASMFTNSLCDTSKHSVFTNLGMFYDWIKQQIQTSTFARILEDDPRCDVNQRCVLYYSCNEDGSINSDGSFLYDERLGGVTVERLGGVAAAEPCPMMEVCCENKNIITATPNSGRL